MKLYLLNWLHTYIVHAETWIATTMLYLAHKNNPKSLLDISGIIKSALLFGSVIALFSSHAHQYYLAFLK